MIDAALVGCAHIHTPGFVRRLKARGDVRVGSVWDHDPERARRNAEQLGAVVVSSPDEVWDDARVTAAIVCSETSLHRELVLAGAAAGKHLFVEKPLGMRAEDAYEMAHALERAGVLFQTGYFMRGNPVNRFLREQVRAGAFGKITRVRVSNGHGGSLGGWFDTEWRWMTDPSQAGFGGFGDLGTHGLDLLLWMLGDEARVESVTATVGTATRRYGDVDEYGEGMLRFGDGVAATLAAGWVDLANPNKLEISGTSGHALHRGDDLYFRSSEVEGADGEGPWTELPEALPHAFELFLDAVGGEDVPLVTPREAALRSSVMAAMYDGAARGAWVMPAEDPNAGG